jgi:hypothetical protein
VSEKQKKVETEDEQIARIIATAEPGVESAMRVLEMTEQRYYAAVSQVAVPAVTVRAVSHS